MSGTIAVEEHSQCVTHKSSSGSRDYRSKTTTITIRIPVWLYERLKEKGILNVSNFVRRLLIMEIEGNLTKEAEIEAELEQLKTEMGKLQNYHSTLLKHGSYAKDYKEKLKDAFIVSHKPFHYSKTHSPSVRIEEIQLVEETVELREKLSKQYREKLKELLELKKKKCNALGISREVTPNQTILDS